MRNSFFKISTKTITTKINQFIRLYSLEDRNKNILLISNKFLENKFENSCAGKTTGLAYISDLLRDRGFEVFVIPECAT